MNEDRLRNALREAPVPDRGAAEERSLSLVRAAYAASPPRRQSRRRGRRELQVAIAVGLIAALVSPAGATVRHWVRNAVEPGRTPSLPALTSLPAPGALLVDSPQGAWVVREDGSKRLLGDYRQSTWSPRGLFVAATRPHQLLALDPLGGVRWTLARSGPVQNPTWSPDGYRVAYLSGNDLRAVGGDGLGDRLVAPRAAAVSPSWRPGQYHVASFVDAAGRVRTVNTDIGSAVFQTRPGLSPIQLSWSHDGSQLLVVQRSELRILDRDGELLWRRSAPQGTELVAATFLRDNRVAGIVAAGPSPGSELLLFTPGASTARLFAGPGRFSGVTPSPDDQWLLLAWQSADQWLFLELAHPRRVVAVSDISAQFGPGTTSPSAFPEVAGWCCRGLLSDPAP
jgi:hypothetical protein